MEHYIASGGVVSKCANVTGCWVKVLQSPFLGSLFVLPNVNEPGRIIRQ